MSACQLAISQNNKAVSLIESGEYQSAIENLSLAVHSFKNLLNDADRTTALETNIDEQMAETTSLLSEDKTHFLYGHAIRIPQDFGETSNECTMISCMVVFNLALAHHLLSGGLVDEEDEHDHASDNQTACGSTELLKAQKLYEIALTMHKDVSPHKKDVVFLLAIFNNLGLVHRQLHDMEASGKCFQHVLSTLMCLTDAGQVSQLSNKLDGFFVNVTGLISKTTVARAA
eukprot:CAMPEP_0178736592 /NCGR_PEP_ID=MMETSP0744-20121128/2522_1 /TAXON_ID=913974 /ORGANISM="Nitzschia punctata, Strain CCMP561" /LENGTH=229 /DNA_ID=CAMNT_0020389075 /DNA_START=86 /DNA_END=775 /DNA_ORIENTATION=+